MFRHELRRPTTNYQPHPHAIGLCCEERVKDTVDVFLLYAGARIFDRNLEADRTRNSDRLFLTGFLLFFYGFVASAQNPLLGSSTKLAFIKPALRSVSVTPFLVWPE